MITAATVRSKPGFSMACLGEDPFKLHPPQIGPTTHGSSTKTDGF
jgi:hypothetical protein